MSTSGTPSLRDRMVQELSASIGPGLIEELVRHYNDVVSRYCLQDWEPSGVDGGQFCEAVANAIYQHDSGKPSPSWNRTVGKVIEYLTDAKVAGQHCLPTKERRHFARVLGVTYKFRSDRGVAHISPSLTANRMDASLILQNVRWLFAEFLRLTWGRTRDEVAEVIEKVTVLKCPAVHYLDGVPLIMKAGLPVPDEVLLLVFLADGGCLPLDTVKQSLPVSPHQIAGALSPLTRNRHMRTAADGTLHITPLGSKYVVEHLSQVIADVLV